MTLETIIERGEPLGYYREHSSVIRHIRAVPKIPVEIGIGRAKHAFYPHRRTHALINQPKEKKFKHSRPKVPEEYISSPMIETSPVLKEVFPHIAEPKTLSITPQTEEIHYKGHAIRFSALPGKIAIYEITKDNQFIEYGTRNTGEGIISDEQLKSFAKGAVENLRELNTPTHVLYKSIMKYVEK